MKKCICRILVSFFALFGAGTSSLFAATPFAFTLPSTQSSYQTSAGVYTSDGVLVRTLWRKVTCSSGSNTAVWDDTDDSGATVPVATYQIRVICHNISYVWEGAVGNSSAVSTGTSVHRGMNPIQDMAISGTKAFYVSGYNEAHYDFRTFNTTDPQRVTDAWGWVMNTLVTPNVLKKLYAFYGRDWAFTATDGTWTYFACPVGWRENPVGAASGVNDQPGYVVAMNAADDGPAYFTNGVRLNNGGCPMYPYPNGIAVGMQPGISGLAVQKSSNILAVAVNTDNQIYFYDKRQGNLLSTLSVPSPRRMAFDSNDNLWVTTNSSVVCYRNVNTNPTLACTLSGFAYPLAVAVSPVDNLVVVADGGSSQQLKGYTITGDALWIYGQAGGYPLNGPAVSDDKFWFTTGGYGTLSEDAFVSFAPDGTFWVGDGDNDRTLHFNSSLAVLEKISTGHTSYVVSVVSNQPTRVFNGFLEYAIDYSKQLVGTAGSWSLVKNWRANLSPDYWGGTYYRKGLLNVTKLSNGATYAQIYNSAMGDWEVCELAANGIRPTGTRLNGGTLNADGSLCRARAAAGNGSFEAGVLAPWAATGGTLSIVSSPMTPADGTKYLNIKVTGNGTQVTGGLYQNVSKINLANGKTFSVSFKVRNGAAGFSSALIGCTSLNSQNGVIQSISASTSAITSSDWTTYQHDFVLQDSQPDFSQLQIKIMLLKSSSVSGTVYEGMIDGIVVNQGTNTVIDEGSPRWLKRSLSGYDGSGSPVWTSESVMASASGFGSSAPLPNEVSMCPVQSPVTDNNIVVSYDQSKNSGFHLGGVRVGDSKWLWKACPSSTHEDFDANAVGNYDVGDGVGNAGNVVQSIGSHIIAGYHGEGWKQMQASQFMHFLDNGLFIGQFGTPGRDANGNYIPFADQVVAGFAGNAMSPVLASAPNGETYLYVNDEWGYGPLRCHLVGLNGLKVYQGSGLLQGSISLSDSTPVVLIAPTIANGSAETGSLSPWSTFYILGSGQQPSVKGTSIVTDAVFAAHLDKCFRLQVSGDPMRLRAQAGIFTNVSGIDLSKGKSFTLSFKVRNAAINGFDVLLTSIISLNSANGAISVVNATTNPVMTSGCWTTYQCKLTLPTAQPDFQRLQVRLQFYKDGSDPALSYAGYVDNLQVVQGQ